MGITGYFGNPGATAETLGGRFSTTPRGVAANDSTGDVYVADSGFNRIQKFDSSGAFQWVIGLDVIQRGKPGGAAPVNEQQTLGLGANTTGGTFQVRWPETANISDPIPFNATVAQIQAALEAPGKTLIGAGNVLVTLMPGGDPGGGATPGGPWQIEFVGAHADTDVPSISPVSGGLTVSSGFKTTPTATVVVGAGAFEKCTVAADCKAGLAESSATILGRGGSLASGSVTTSWGIAINQATGDFYVANQGLQRIEQFSDSGAFIRAWGIGVVASGPGNVPQNEVQTATIKGGPTGGTFQLRFGGTAPVNSSAPISFNASPAEVQSALEAIAGIGAGNVAVTSSNPGGGTEPGGPYVIEFNGALGDKNVEALTAAAGGLTPSGEKSIEITPNQQGASSFEICTVAADCQRAVNSQQNSNGGLGGGLLSTMGGLAVVPSGAANAGSVFVADTSNRRLQEFTAGGGFVRAVGFDVVSAGPSNNGTGFEICRAAASDVCKAGVGGTGPGQLPSFPTVSSLTIRLAADTDGNLYAAESGPGPAANLRVQKFAPAGETLTPSILNPSIGASETLSGTAAANTPLDVAVDPTDDHLYVVRAIEAGKGEPAANTAERRIFELDAAGSLVETHLANSALNAVNGFALKVGGESGYLTSSTPKAGVNVIGEPIPPTVAIEATTDVTTDSATLHGIVNPNGGIPLTTTYRFEYRIVGDSAWSKVPTPDGDVGSGEAPVQVTHAIGDLQANRDYEVRLVATKGGAPTISVGSAGDFSTDPAPPAVQTFPAVFDTSSGELVLRGSVNPKNAPTTYYFEYGPEPCTPGPCESVPVGQDGAAGSGGEAVTRTERIAGLEPGVTYHFRIVAENGVEVAPGETEARGDELTLTTPPAETCANEALRTGPSEQLVECRAFEWVSAGDSWGVGIGAPEAIGDSGNRAQFMAQAFGQPQSTPGINNVYTAERGPTGWGAKAMAPAPDRAFISIFGGSDMSAADLGSVLWSESTLGERQRGEVRWTIVGLDGSRAAALPPIRPLDHLPGANKDLGLKFELRGGAPDLSTFVYRLTHEQTDTGYKYFPDETIIDLAQRTNLYQIIDAGEPGAEFDIVNRADGEAGAVLGGVCGAGLGSELVPSDGGFMSNAVSADGSVVYFSTNLAAPTSGACEESLLQKRVYKRIDDEHTVQVSAAQCSCGGPGGDDEYQGASADGSVVFFKTPRRLLAADTDSANDLYIYDADPPSGQPELVLASGGSGAAVIHVLGNAADGSRVYFAAAGVLAGSNDRGESPVLGEPNVYVYQRDDAHPTGRLAFVARRSNKDLAPSSGISQPLSELAASSRALPSLGGVGNGRFLLFTSVAPILAEDTDAAADLYRYDDSSGEMLCLSCIGNGNADVNIRKVVVGNSFASAEQRARPASADVSAVTFTTVEGLVDEDLNGASDAYLWREGALSLVSVGSGEEGAVGAGISPDGNNVFFTTRTPLVGADTNNALDLYDARIGGGFPEPEPVLLCASDEACRPSSRAAPGVVAPSSSSFEGAGNRVRKPCPKGKVRRKGRCVRKKSDKRPGMDRRAGGKRGGTR